MLTGRLAFYFIARSDENYVNNKRDLATKKVCVLLQPNLNALVILEVLDRSTESQLVKV